MKIVAYLNFKGTCREAFEFYKEVFAGELTAMISHEDMGIPGLDEHAKKLILHARLVIGDETLMGSDVMGDISATPAPVQVSLQLTSIEETERIYKALSEGGEILMPLEEQEWAARFGFLRDRFGIPWMLNCETNS